MTEVASVLVGRGDIRRRVQELGRTIAGDYVGREPVLVTVLKGGAVFLADLMRATPLALEPHFMAISRYGDAEESLGRVQILLDVDIDLAGRDGASRPSAERRIVDGLGRMRAVVRHVVPLVLEECPQVLLQGEARVVAGERDPHPASWTGRADGYWRRRCASASRPH